ncbi:MerR family transcriptional regulator [Micromonospora sp. NPDC003197]
MGDDALSAGMVARRLGVAVTTLRTWHQRYGLGPSRHVAGQHRRYTPADLARLEIMRRLTADGVPPAEAARWARQTPDVRGQQPAATAPQPEPVRGEPHQAEPHQAEPVRAGGGRAIPVGRAGPAARGLARAALRLDAVGLRESVTRAIASKGVIATWNDMICPVLVGIGERHAATTGLIEVEHLVSRCVSEALAVVDRSPASAEPPRILLACADEEQHSLPLEALAAALAEIGVPCRLLGARVPTPALVEAVNRTGPVAVVIWSHAPATADPGQLAALLASPRRPLLVAAAGPGWRLADLPGEVIHPTSLDGAVALVRGVPGQPGR